MKLALNDPISRALKMASKNDTGLVSIKPEVDLLLNSASLYWTTVIDIIDKRCSVDRLSFLRTVINPDNRVIQAIVSGRNITTHLIHFKVIEWFSNRNYDRVVIRDIDIAFAKCKNSRYCPVNREW